MIQFNDTTHDLQTELDQHKSALEQFIVNGMTRFRTGLTQREEAISQLTAENEHLRNQLITAEANLAAAQADVAARDASLALAASQIAELEQLLANLNSGIDAAQAGA
jgi:chromosome segregation ATPase